MSIERSRVLASLPPIWPVSLLSQIQERVAGTGKKIVVLDDDPTGTQTVHGVPVLTNWRVESLVEELKHEGPVVYILTNSRSVSLSQAQCMNKEIGQNLALATQKAGRAFVVVSRSDSTLRGHFPGEVEALEEGLGSRIDAWLIIPFFEEGRRVTIHDIHYVTEGDLLIPVGETEFARDSSFGYHSSDLKRWVQEKTRGRISSTSVKSVPLTEIREGGPAAVASFLIALERRSVCVVNAVCYRDIEVFVEGLLQAEERGKYFLYRTAASFVRVRSGISPRPLLTPAELSLGLGGGALFIVGSHVSRSTAQLEALVASNGIHDIELRVKDVLQEKHKEGEISRVVEIVESCLDNGQDAVVHTSRAIVTTADAASNLFIGQRISDSLAAVVQRISTRPRYLLAKGGITSSDIAVKGLGVQRATVIGQILPGVPVWSLGTESRHPGMSYIVFPGNVGGPKALVQIRRMLSRKE